MIETLSSLEEVNLSHNPGVIGTIPSELTQVSGLRKYFLTSSGFDVCHFQPHQVYVVYNRHS